MRHGVYGRLLLMFSYQTRGPVDPEVVFVRWFIPASKAAHARNLRLQSFKYAKCKLPGIASKVFQTDVVALTSIIGPGFTQPDPIDSNIILLQPLGSNWNTANGIQ